MARVFVSYRRADGPFAVNWLADRLGALDSVNHVESAFHDRDLRAGDDFAAALEAEIAEAELVIVAIGPEWLGPDAEHPRTCDESDWVVREIRVALQQGTVVLPVLVDGATPPLESQLHPAIRDLARLHALPFNSSDELDKIVAHADSHLREIDAERTALAGLAEPVELAPLGGRVALGWFAAACAVAFGAGTAALFAILGLDELADDDLTPVFLAAVVAVAVVGGVQLVLSTALVARLRRDTRLDVRRAVPIASAWLLVVLLTWSGMMWSGLQVVLMDASWPWIALAASFGVAAGAGAFGSEVLLFAVICTSPRVRRGGIADDALHHALCSDSQRWGVVALGFGGSLLVAVAAIVLAIAGADGGGGLDVGGAALVLSLGSIMTVALAGAHLWTTARLSGLRDAIDLAVSRLPRAAQENSVVPLPATTFSARGRGLRLAIALPLGVAVFGATLVIVWSSVA